MLERWNDAMDVLEGRLAGQVEVAELARVALTSEYHFRRVFSVLAGIPLSEYVRRRRITVATASVLDGERVLAPSCCRVPTAGMKVSSKSERALKSQKLVLELLLCIFAAAAGVRGLIRHLNSVRVSRVFAARCHGCGYDLRVNPGRCPECGSPTIARTGRGINHLSGRGE